MTDAAFQEESGSNAPDEIAALKRRIDDIATFGKHDGPWYKNTGLTISAAAFFISVMTTVVSWYHTYQQDVAALQTQLRATLQQTNQLALLNIELPAKFKDSQNDFLNASSTLNTQNLMFAQQAYSIAKALGNAASSLQLTATAAALINSGQIGLAEEMLSSAVDRAANSTEYTSAARTLAAIQFQGGRRDEAIATFKNIVQVFDRFPGEAKYDFNVNLTQAYSYIFWTGAVMLADCRLAKETLAGTGQYMSRLPAGNAAVSAMQSQIVKYNAALAACS
jgi:tetratricopeptide (TPR) repeat protein